MKPELRAALLAQTEARQELNALPDDATDEARAAALETLNAADQAAAEHLAKEPEDRGDGPAELRDRISLGRYLAGIASQAVLDGAEGELRQELNLGDQQVPLEALLPTPEERADAISPQDTSGDLLTSGAINRTTGPMLRRLFTATDAAFLGVGMPSVPAGERRYPVMTDGTTAAMSARGSGPDAGAAKFDVVDVNPKRLTGRYVFDLEGVAEMGGMLESTLRSDLRTEMGYQLDLQLLNGDGTGNNISGILKELTATLAPGQTVTSNEVPLISWALARQMVYGSVDGKYARTEANERFLLGQTTYDLLRASFRNENAGDAADAIMAIADLGAGSRRSFQIPAPKVGQLPTGTAASKKAWQWAVLNREPAAAVAPVWQGITMIRDPYTNARGAQVLLTAHMLFGFAFRRKAGWAKYPIRTAA